MNDVSTPSAPDDKQALTDQRVALIQRLNQARSPDDIARIQAELRYVNAQIKALNTTKAAQDKAAADRRKAAGLAEQHANTQRAIERAQAKAQASPQPSHSSAEDEDEDQDDDPGQTRAIDGWIDGLLLRHDIEFTRNVRGLAICADIPRNVTAAIELLIAGVNAAARGQELPDLPERPKAEAKPAKAAKAKKRS